MQVAAVAVGGGQVLEPEGVDGGAALDGPHHPGLVGGAVGGRAGPLRRAAQAVAGHRPGGQEAVLEVDLLALGVGAGPVADRHLEDDQPLAQEVGGQLHLHGEGLGGQRQAPERLAGEHLVAGVHVRQVAVEGHVDHQVEQPVGDPVGVVEAGRAAPEAAAVDDLVVAVQDRLDQRRQVAGVVLEVGVLDAEDVAGGRLQARLDRGPLAPVGGVDDHPDVVAGERVEQAAPGVGGAVVDEDQLRLQAKGVEVDLEETVDHRRERPQFVVERDDHRQLHGHLLPIRQQPAKYHVAAAFRREGRRPRRVA